MFDVSALSVTIEQLRLFVARLDYTSPVERAVGEEVNEYLLSMHSLKESIQSGSIYQGQADA